VNGGPKRLGGGREALSLRRVPGITAVQICCSMTLKRVGGCSGSHININIDIDIVTLSSLPLLAT